MHRSRGAAPRGGAVRRSSVDFPVESKAIDSRTGAKSEELRAKAAAKVLTQRIDGNSSRLRIPSPHRI